MVRICGCANVTQLVQDAQGLLGPNVTERFTEALIRAGGPFEWLDRESKWFWYITDGSNRVVQQVQRSLALSGRIKLSMVRSAIQRDNGLGNFTPPTKIIEAVCRRVLGWQIEGDSISQVPAMAQRNDALAPNERLLATILREHGPAIERAKLMELCRARGIDDQAFEQLVRPSLLLHENEQGLVASSDTELGTAPTADAENGDPLAARSQALLSEGKVLLAWKLQPSIVESGALRVPEPINSFVQGDYSLRTLGGSREIGLLHIRQRACWDVRRLVLALGGEPDDTLAIVINPRNRTAAGLIGADDVAKHVASGLPQASHLDTVALAELDLTRNIA
jgi:hypothetical protein